MKEFTVNIEIERNGDPVQVDVMIFDMIPCSKRNSWGISSDYTGYSLDNTPHALDERERKKAESKAIETLEQQMLKKHESEVDCWIEEMKERE